MAESNHDCEMSCFSICSAANGPRSTNVNIKKLSHLASNLTLACCKPSSLTTSTLFSAKREVDAVTIRSARLWAELDATLGVIKGEENV